MKLFTPTLLLYLLVSPLIFGFSQLAKADPDWKHSDNYYAHTNPHYGQVDSDGILSPGEIRNPLINYHNYDSFNDKHDKDRHNCDYKNPYQNYGQNYGWLKYPSQKPSSHYYDEHQPSNWSDWSRAPYYRNR